MILAWIVISTVVLHFKSKWWHENWLLTFVCIFQTLPAVWRTLFLLNGGFKGATAWTFITYRSSDAGDLVVSLTCFAMYLNCICTKYSNLSNPDFNYKSYKCRQYGWFWLFFVIYSCFWGTAYWFSLDRNTLSYVDYFVSGYFLVCIVLFIVFGKRLIDRI